MPFHLEQSLSGYQCYQITTIGPQTMSSSWFREKVNDLVVSPRQTML